MAQQVHSASHDPTSEKAEVEEEVNTVNEGEGMAIEDEQEELGRLDAPEAVQ